MMKYTSQTDKEEQEITFNHFAFIVLYLCWPVEGSVDPSIQILGSPC